MSDYYKEREYIKSLLKDFALTVNARETEELVAEAIRQKFLKSRYFQAKEAERRIAKINRDNIRFPFFIGKRLNKITYSIPENMRVELNARLRNYKFYIKDFVVACIMEFLEDEEPFIDILYNYSEKNNLKTFSKLKRDKKKEESENQRKLETKLSYSQKEREDIYSLIEGDVFEYEELFEEL